MYSFPLPTSHKGPLRILCLGAHSDDIEIGCAGTLLTMLASRKNTVVTWVVLAASGKRGDEAKRGASLVLGAAAKYELFLHTFRDGFFPQASGEIKNQFEELKKRSTYDLIFTHYRNDRHQDHRVISDLTWNTFRNHLVLEYEIPKYDGDLGQPNCFVPLAPSVVTRKIKILNSAFGTQRGKHWFDDETFRGLMRLRGMEAASQSKYAEAYYARKIVIA